MKGEPGYNGPLLIDPRDPKLAVIKLTSDQIKILKATTNIISTLQTKSIAKDQTTQRELATLIQIIGLTSFNNQNVNILYKYYRFWYLSKEGHLISSKGTYRNTSNKGTSHQRIPLVGMDNWHTVICYLDSLLVSLFYSNDTLDFLLDETEFYNNSNEEVADELRKNIKELKILLRYVVNLLRSGEFIGVQLMKQLCISFYDLGCDLTLSNRQEDALQFFEFFADCLSLPLLTIKLDIIHAGKMNLNDDLRLVEERALLISIPTDIDYTGEQAIKEEGTKDEAKYKDDKNKTGLSNSVLDNNHPLEDPVSLEECLNSYFNNSITVKRHLDKRRATLNTLDGLKSAPSFLESLRNGNTNPKDDNEDSLKDYLEYEKLGVVTPVLPSASEFQSVHTAHNPNSSSSIHGKQAISPVLTSGSSSINLTIKSGEDSLYEAIDGVKTKTNHIENLMSYEGDQDITPLQPTTSGAISDYDENDDDYVDAGITPDLKSKSDEDQFSLSPKLSPVRPSISKVSAFSEVSRTRSSTIVSVLNNVAAANPGSLKLSKRTSSFSNNEVTLPAWMFLQLLPYYTDPNIKFKPENHEEYYRNKYIRSNTIEGDLPNIPLNSKFDARYRNKRPIVPICLKRYVWDSCGKSHKIKRKINIPQIIKYPYFIAEDKQISKPGLVNFERTTENIAPAGSFMLVLESCVCHRGTSVHSGHYVSVTRKTPFKASIKRHPKQRNSDKESTPCDDKMNSDDEEPVNDNGYATDEDLQKNDKWLIFNDLEPKGMKTKETTFEEAMEQEDPYILFYRIVNLDEGVNESLSEESDGFISEDNSTLKQGIPVPVKLQSGSKEKFWSEASDSSAPNSVLLDTRKGSLVSQVSSISLKSQFQQQQQKKQIDEFLSGGVGSSGSESTITKDQLENHADSITTPSILITPTDGTTSTTSAAASSSAKPLNGTNQQLMAAQGSSLPPPPPPAPTTTTTTATNTAASSGNGLKNKHFYFMSSRSNLKVHKETMEDDSSLHHHHHHHVHLLPHSHEGSITKISLDDINPLDPNYIDIKQMYYWYNLTKDGQFGEIITNENAHKFSGSIEEGGILERLNSKLSFAGLKRNSLAQSFTTSFSKDKDKERQSESLPTQQPPLPPLPTVDSLPSQTTDSQTGLSPAAAAAAAAAAVPPPSFFSIEQEASNNNSPSPAPAIPQQAAAAPPPSQQQQVASSTPMGDPIGIGLIPPSSRHFKNALNEVKSNSSSVKSSRSTRSKLGEHSHHTHKENGKLKKFFKKLI